MTGRRQRGLCFLLLMSLSSENNKSAGMSSGTMPTATNWWDDRYSGNGDPTEFAYGTEPNDFLKETCTSLSNLAASQQQQQQQQQTSLPTCLMLADGEGRNGVYMAQQGYQVVAVDFSQVGLDKAQRLAETQSVSKNFTTELADLSEYDLGTEKWNVIVGISCHFPPLVRQRVLKEIPTALKPGGHFLLECYTPDQLNFQTGGPPTSDMMYSKEILSTTLEDHLETVRNVELIRNIAEGKYHTGQSAVVQYIGKKALHTDE